MRFPRCLIGLTTGTLVAVACLPVGCHHSGEPKSDDAGAAGPAWFEDVTGAVGLDFLHDAGPVGEYFMPQIVGSGAALFDCDSDGRLDIYLIQNAGPKSQARNRLYRQRPDGRFEDVSAGSGLDVAGYGMGVAIGDVNNDGFPDVVLTQYGGSRLFLNDGKGHFTEATRQLDPGDALWGASACFFDYDRDGWLDLVVTHYVDYDPSWSCFDSAGRRDFCYPNSFPGAITKLYHNLGRGPDGRWRGFKDVTLDSGLGDMRGTGLGVVCADFDGDGWPDIFVANDSQPNRLWINRHNSTFKEEAFSRGLAVNGQAQIQANMGIALGDIDGDGLFDLYVTHLTEEGNVLWKQGPRGAFQDRSSASGLTQVQWRGTGFGTVFGDFDLDGSLDLAVVNGRVYRRAQAAGGAEPFWARYAERNQLLANGGHGDFRDISAHNGPFCGTPGVYRGLAVGDVFNRGALDLLVTEAAGRARLFRNVAPRQGHWLEVSAVDPACGGRDAYGAVITARAGSQRWVRWLNPGYSYLTSNDPRVHFGLGGVNHIDSLHVVWPDGSEEDYPGQAADRPIRVVRGQGARGDSQK